MSDRPIFYIARLLPEYRIPILERLNDRLGGRLVVFHGDPPGGSSLATLTQRQEHGFRTIRLKNRWIRGESIHYQSPGPVFREEPAPAAILAEESPRSISLPLLMLKARKRRIPVILWGHFSSNHRAASRNHLFDRYRLSLARSADACLCYTEQIAELLRPWIPDQKLFVARNTLEMDSHRSWRRRLEAEGRDEVRSRLGIPRDALVLSFIGRLDQEKATDRLIPILRALPERLRAMLVVIGDGPTRSHLEAESESENLILTGALSPEQAAPWLFAADIMVLPGRVGLAVNHAFAYGLPVVLRNSPHAGRYHSPEIAFVRTGENAEIAAGGATTAFVAAIERIAADLPLYSRSALLTAQTELTTEIMIAGILDAIRKVSNDA